MKLKLLSLLLFSIGVVNAQDSEGALEIKRNKTEKFSISQEQQHLVRQQVLSNVEELKRRGIINNNTVSQRGGHVLLQWPLTTSDPRFRETWAIDYYVDHNLNFNNQISDYNCGTQTFDGNSFNNEYTGIYLNPFSIYQMENNITQIVAAADGVIVFKDDTQPDTSCGATPGTFYNVITVQHNDGTYLQYYGIKNGASTPKLVGDTVTAGEFLGYLGNAGGTYPELFIRLFDTDGLTILDPFFGACNSSNVDSWWIQQPDYVNSKVNSVFTHDALPDFNVCPEDTNFRDFFNDESVKMIGYFTDAVAGTSLNFQLQRPNGTLAIDEDAIWDTSYRAAYYQFTRTAATFNQSGTWIARFTYNGTSFEHPFEYVSMGVTSNEKLNRIQLSPNPTSGIVSISSEIKINHFTIFDASGRSVYEMNKNDIRNIDIASLSNGVYFVELESTEGKIVKKIIKE